ncbi:hypothetical protein MLD38_032525 [Melastoma candidum]|uniref:Uncharacterized protein n=1 Tax=Melastoma candidum TaxID=119954 RepID=A0ACB9M5P8_9MYRT|nr:hypothetical protein MLD38_032525 [Melastoma candidum]
MAYAAPVHFISRLRATADGFVVFAQVRVVVKVRVQEVFDRRTGRWAMLCSWGLKGWVRNRRDWFHGGSVLGDVGIGGRDGAELSPASRFYPCSDDPGGRVRVQTNSLTTTSCVGAYPANFYTLPRDKEYTVWRV